MEGKHPVLMTGRDSNVGSKRFSWSLSVWNAEPQPSELLDHIRSHLLLGPFYPQCKSVASSAANSECELISLVSFLAVSNALYQRLAGRRVCIQVDSKGTPHLSLMCIDIPLAQPWTRPSELCIGPLVRG